MPKLSRKSGKGPSRRFSSMAGLSGDMSHGDKSLDMEGDSLNHDPRASTSTATSGMNVSWSLNGK